jgi:hypothetical protein
MLGGPVANIVPFTMLFYGTHYPLYYQHRRHVEGVTIIESSLGTRQGDPLRGPLFVLAHYRTLLETIAQALNCIYPSLTNYIHIVGPTSEISCAFDHILTQLTQVGLRVTVLKCKFWSP